MWTMVVGGYFTWISIYGINQTQVQRYLTVKKTSQAVT
jgi:sodium-coupled monocarboxylate transporter 8/12